jgi:hypothetical protein
MWDDTGLQSTAEDQERYGMMTWENLSSGPRSGFFGAHTVTHPILTTTLLIIVRSERADDG